VVIEDMFQDFGADDFIEGGIPERQAGYVSSGEKPLSPDFPLLFHEIKCVVSFFKVLFLDIQGINQAIISLASLPTVSALTAADV
jgi:hypothetical protein